jgi:SAM-dependent methyltransferase
MESEDWVPPGIDVEQPSPARVYDYYLGGAHNFAADRKVAEQVLAANPDGPRMAWANRAFLRRAVQFLVNSGVRQLLDLGSGIPTVDHVHEIAQRTAPDARVVYVDVDPVAVAHSRQILAGNDRTAVIQEDVRNAEAILDAPEARGLFDFDQPIAVLAIALFHFIPDSGDPAGIISRLTEPLVSGSYLALSHLTADGPLDMATMTEIFRRGGIEFTMRTRQQVEALFTGVDLVDPGVVWVPEWRPESSSDLHYDQPEISANYGGVGRKP